VNKLYFTLILITSLIQLPVTILLNNDRSDVIAFFLAFFTLIDILFIIKNIKKIRFTKLDTLYLFFLFFSVLIGFLYNEISRRYISDFLLPFNFLLKMIIVRNGVKYKKFSEDFIWFIKKYATVTFVSGIISVCLFYFYKTGDFEYLGLTPVVYPKLIRSLQGGSPLFVIGCFLIAFLSGKRAILMGCTTIFLTFMLFIKKVNGLKFYLPFAIIALVMFIWPQNDTIKSSQAGNKLSYTLQEANVNDVSTLDKLTGGRFAEVESINETMGPIDYLIGKGIGFTYTFKRGGEVIAEEYGNAHFSPMSIISKYGSLFFILLSTYLLTGVKQIFNSNLNYKFFALFILGCMVEYLFAYGIFIDKLMPLALGYLQFKNSAKINSIQLNS
jgi:hypothetical protein